MELGDAAPRDERSRLTARHTRAAPSKILCAHQCLSRVRSPLGDASVYTVEGDLDGRWTDTARSPAYARPAATKAAGVGAAAFVIVRTENVEGRTLIAVGEQRNGSRTAEAQIYLERTRWGIHSHGTV
ncbi:hypothetical protein GCM10009608_10000 [Pseudonocardia alaniniphila]